MNFLVVLICIFNVYCRVFTTLSDTGERMYLSEMLPGGLNPDDIFAEEYAHLSHRPAELDITHLLPSWSLRLRSFPPATDYSTTLPTAPATIFRNERSVHPFLIGLHEGRVRIELVGAPKDLQPLAFRDVSILGSGKNDFVRLKAECVSWMITLSGQLEPHPSVDALLRSSTDLYGAVEGDEAARQPLLPNEKKMVADFVAHPHPRVLELVVRGRDPTDVHVVTATLNSDALQNVSSASQSVSCPLGKIALSLVLEDGSEIGLHQLPKGQVRVSALLRSSKKIAVWDPAVALHIAPVTEEGKALVAAGKLGHGPMIDMKSIALWTGQPQCAPKASVFLTNGRPLVSISAGQQQDPGPPGQKYDWEQEAIEKFRRDTGPMVGGSFDYSRSHFLVPRDSLSPGSPTSTPSSSSSFLSSPMKYALFGVIIFSVVFLTAGCLALIIIRHRKVVRRRKARIEDDPNNPLNTGGGKNTDPASGVYPVSPQMSSTTAAAMMNPGLSCSSVFSGGSGGAGAPAQTADVINQWTGRQQQSMALPQQCSACSNSVGTRSPQSDPAHANLRTGGLVDMRYQVTTPSLRLNTAFGGFMHPSSPNFNSKWQTPESLGSAPSSRNTGSPSTNDEGFASGPLDLPPLGHLYYNTSTRADNGGWGGAGGSTQQPPCSCQTGSPHTSHHSSDLGRGSACGNAYYLPGGLMGSSMAAESGRLFTGSSLTSAAAPDAIPPRLTLAHDPESIGTGKYNSKHTQFPPTLLLPAELLKMKTSQTTGTGFIGDTMDEKLMMDSGRESQDKASSSGASSGMNKDLSSMSGIEIAQVDV
ncbi:unnamed protein product [Mesocestoides corti]|uniref:Uncharacterized protein n=3 Tax=Mesocestoides corti TaxID=53468 RepID=A0A0R3UJN6_MESCO|nr:unnamed protein product [Mesocestoides corti]